MSDFNRTMENNSSSSNLDSGNVADGLGAIFDDINNGKIKDTGDLSKALGGSILAKRYGNAIDVIDIGEALNSDNSESALTKALAKIGASEVGAKYGIKMASALTGSAPMHPLAKLALLGIGAIVGGLGGEYAVDMIFNAPELADKYAKPFYTISDETEYEGETMVFKLRFKETPKSSVIINFKTIGYTATENDDFEYKNETLTISPDDIKNGVYEYKVKIHNDSEFDEGKEYFILRTELMNKENFPNLVQDFYIEEDVPFIVQGQGNILEKETVYITIQDKTLQEGDESCYLDKIAVTLSRELKDNETISVNFSNQILVS